MGFLCNDFLLLVAPNSPLPKKSFIIERNPSIFFRLYREVGDDLPLPYFLDVLRVEILCTKDRLMTCFACLVQHFYQLFFLFFHWAFHQCSEKKRPMTLISLLMRELFL